MVFGVFFRLLPHVANVSPLFAAAVLLVGATGNSKAILLALLSFALSDVLWGTVTHHAIIGTWTIFTWSGLVIALLANRFVKNKLFIHFTAFSLIYWCWTNLGVWLASGMYMHSAYGFIACYTSALPFLFNQWLGLLVWGYAIYYLKPALNVLLGKKITKHKLI
jgi:hypothetical protein